MVWSITVEFSPGTGPFDSPSWVDISDRVMSLSWTVGTQQELSDYPPGEATVVLDNSDRLFDPDNTAGTYYGDLLPRVPFRIRCEVADPILDNGEYVVDDTGQVVVDNTTTVYDLFYGFVEDGWEQGYEPPDTATCTVKLIDLLAVLEGYTLPSVLDAEIRADNPIRYWPLDEPHGQEMRDVIGGAVGEYTAGVKAETWEPANGVLMTNRRYQAEGHGVTTDQGVVLTGSPATAEMLFVRTEEAQSVSPGMAFFTVPFRQGTGNAEAATVINVGTYVPPVDTYHGRVMGRFRWTGTDVVATPRHIARVGSPVLVMLESPDNSTQAIWVNGNTYTETLAGNVAPDAFKGTAIGGGAYGMDQDDLRGFIGFVALYDAVLDAGRKQAHYEAAFAPLAGRRSDEQVEWILDQVGVPVSMRDIDTGRSLMGPLNSKGRNALELLREIAATEQGALFVDHAAGGKIRFRERYHSWMNPRAVSPQAVFTDDPSVTLNRVEPDTLAMDSNGVRSIINRVTVSWIGGEETVEDTASSAAYGPRGISLSTASRTAAVARGVGHWITLQNAQPKTRVRGFGLDVGGDPAGVYPACSLRIGDRVEFAHKPQDTGNRTIRQLELLGASHQVDGVTWRTSFYLRDSPSDSLTLFTLDVSELDGPDILAY